MKDEKLLQRLVGYSFAVMVIVLCMAVALRFKNFTAEQETREKGENIARTPVEDAKNEIAPGEMSDVAAVVQARHATDEEVWEVWQFLSQEEKEQMSGELARECILIRKPEGEKICWEVSEYLPDYQITFSVTGAEKSLLMASVLRLWNGEYYYGQPDEVEILKDLSILSYQDENGMTTDISMVFDRCYIPVVTEMEKYYVIHLQRYKEVYDRIVVLDAGHGGKDRGAGAKNYAIVESELTLKLMLYLKELLESDTDIKVFCTRTEDVYPTLEDRVELALGLEADLFISWHCNSFTASWKNGTEVLYNEQQGVENRFNSKAFANLCLDKLVGALGTKNGGIWDRQDLHIVRRATMPMVLLETAYMSNESDLALLKDDKMLKKAAQAVYECILEAYELMEETE